MINFEGYDNLALQAFVGTRTCVRGFGRWFPGLMQLELEVRSLFLYRFICLFWSGRSTIIIIICYNPTPLAMGNLNPRKLLSSSMVNDPESGIFEPLCALSPWTEGVFQARATLAQIKPDSNTWLKRPPGVIGVKRCAVKVYYVAQLKDCASAMGMFISRSDFTRSS